MSAEEVRIRDLSYQKRLAAKVAGVGLDRVRIDPERVEEVAEAVTREDIRKLIHKGAIVILPARGVSRARVKRGRKGPGRRKGGKYSTLTRKERWVRRIRALRRALRRMRDSGIITKREYRTLYRRLSQFSSVRHLRSHVLSAKREGG